MTSRCWGLLQEGVEGLFDLVVEVRWSAVEDAGGLASAVEEEERGNGGDVAEGLSGRGVSDSPVQVGTEGAHGGANLVLGGFDCKGKDGELVAVFMLQIAEPLESGTAGRTPGSPELDENDATGEFVCGKRMAGEIGQLELRKGSEFVSGGAGAKVLAANDVFFARQD